MRSVNKVILIGNLTRDPKMNTTQNGQVITTFGIATNREWTTGGSERKKSTEFHEVAAWSKLGEICNKFLRKGKLIYVEGYLKTRTWEDESGEKRFRTEIVLQDMIMLDRRSDSDNSSTTTEVAEEKSSNLDGDLDEFASPTEDSSTSEDETETSDDNLF